MHRENGQPRTRCRLPCVIRAGRGRVHARVVDVSSGGLCFVAPVCFRPRARVRVEIIVPRGQPVAVEGEVRHRRPYRQPTSGRRGWATGLALAIASPEFLALSTPGAYVEPIAAAPNRARHGVYVITHPISPPLLTAEQSLYRVQLKAVGSSRTLSLTLRAVSESAVCEAVLRDLPGDWEVLDVELDPID